MAYQTRGQFKNRDPLLDSKMQAAIEKRGRELAGIALVVVGLMVAAMIWSYTPDDPNWMVASDAPVQNWMGRLGASLAHPIFMIAGYGAWMIPAVLVVWGTRMAGNWGSNRAVARLIFAPIAAALAAVYAATLAPGIGWPHSFGMGGLFGDTVLSILLTTLPIGVGIGVKIMSLLAGVLTLAAGGFVLGLTKPELRIGWRFFLFGLVVVYAVALKVLGQTARVSLRAGQIVQHKVQDTVAERREQAALNRAEAEEEAAAALAVPGPQVSAAPRAQETTMSAAFGGRVRRATMAADPAPMARAEPDLVAPASNAPQLGGAPNMPPTMHFGADAGLAAPARRAETETPVEEPAPARGGLLGRMPNLLKRTVKTPEPEAPEPQAAPLGREDRVLARINDVIRARAEQSLPVSAPTLSDKGPSPLILDLAPHAQPEPVAPALPAADRAARAEPPVAMSQAPVLPPLVAQRHPSSPAAAFAPEEEHVIEPLVESAPRAVADPAAPDALADALPKYSVPFAAQKKVVQHKVRRAVQPSTRAKAEAQPLLPLEEAPAPSYDYPPLALLADPDVVEQHHLSDDALEENARLLESVLDDYGVKGEIVSVRPGPVVTMYELEPAPGLKASRVIGLADDIARSMSALSARVSTVPGRSIIGIELPNEKREMVVLREILSARAFGDSNMKLPLALGKDIGGEPVVANLAKMPHLLIAGTTGSGKSVAINTMILSLLYKLSPSECRMIMIDPKMLELSVYDGIPHLLSPVVTDPKKAVVALKWVVGEMEDRYRKMSKMGVRNIDGYNSRVADVLAKGELFERTVQTGFDDETGDPIFETEETVPEKMPYIVIIVDEMADLMMVAGKEIEACIQRLAQMARASGIHLIMATQRPSVDVITGTIKANFPTRISFQVTSKIDSRTILGEQGAEQLLGMGDMLYMAGGSKITRVHGPFCSDEEVEEVVNHLKSYGPPVYVTGVADGPDEATESSIDRVLGLGGNTDSGDALYDEAVHIVARDRKCSTSYIQRKLAIGYNKAARLVEQMEDEGLVTPANHVGKRDVLLPEIQEEY